MTYVFIANADGYLSWIDLIGFAASRTLSFCSLSPLDSNSQWQASSLYMMLEEDSSRKLHQQRLQLQQQQQNHHHRRLHQGPQKPQRDTQHGIMIDAGSQGTRLHVYEFEPRYLSHREHVDEVIQGKRLSFPATESRWTSRLKPGLDYFAFVEPVDNQEREVRLYLEPLLAFAKETLAEKQEHWAKYPVYLKATGGCRALPVSYRLRLMATVRELFRNTTFNPFYFEEEHARVISGEEEAIYGWAAVNFVKGTLIANSEGSGSVLAPNLTYGMLEMGGASTQIAYFEPNGDVMANLFKLQIGAAKHWNVYAHSFLYFGVNGAYARHNARLVAEASVNTSRTNSVGGIYNPCLPGGSHSIYTSRVRMDANGTLVPLSSATDPNILEADLRAAVLQNDNVRGDFDQCFLEVHKLLRKEANAWCDFAHDRDCSFAGVYQPPLPIGAKEFGEFIVTSNFHSVWDFLGLDARVPLSELREGARRICNMGYLELKEYNKQLPSPKDDDDLLEYCFRATFVSALLNEGVGFPMEYHVTAIDVIDGKKLGWALGSILYEINTLPWEFPSHHTMKKLTPKLQLDEVLLGDSSMGRVPMAAFVFLGIVCVALFSALQAFTSRRTDTSSHASSPRKVIGTAQSNCVKTYGATN